MRSLFLFLAISAYVHFAHEVPAFIDPTGTYILKGDIKKNNIKGHFGELRVRLLDSQTVAFCFYINDGYPDYASGAMVDTLKYVDNRIIYKPAGDSGCSLFLYFHLNNVELMEVYSDPHSGCGFAPGVLTPAVFVKKSAEIPVIQDLSRREQAG